MVTELVDQAWSSVDDSEAQKLVQPMDLHWLYTSKVTWAPVCAGILFDHQAIHPQHQLDYFYSLHVEACVAVLYVCDGEVSLDVEGTLPPNTVVVDHHDKEGSLFYRHTGVEPNFWVRDLPTSSISIEVSPNVRREDHFHLHDDSSFLAFHHVPLYELSLRCMSLVGFFHV